MGAHSSWPTFTLCHHLVVHYCASLHGFKPLEFEHYRLLGDDIVICHDQVAEEYEKFMTQILGVDISQTKSHVSEDTFELAKRWLYRGVEVTPFPVVGFHEFYGKFHLIAELWRQTLERGFEYLQWVGNTRSLVPLLEALGYSGRRLSRELRLIQAQSILTKFSLSDEDYNRIYDVLKFMNLFNLHPRCSDRDATIIKRFDDIASYQYFQRQSEMADMASTKVRHWNFNLATALEESPDLGPDDQSELSDHWAETIPGICALADKSRESRDLAFSSAISSNQPSHLVWKKLPGTKVLAIPSESGIIPTRAAHLRTGSAAILMRDIVKYYYRLYDEQQEALRS